MRYSARFKQKFYVKWLSIDKMNDENGLEMIKI